MLDPSPLLLHSKDINNWVFADKHNGGQYRIDIPSNQLDNLGLDEWFF